MGRSASRVVSNSKQILRKCVLNADRFMHDRLAHGPVIDAARNPIKMLAHHAEVLEQKRKGLRSKVEARVNAVTVHLGARRQSDSVKLPDRHVLDEGRPHFWRDNEQPVELAMIRCEFCEKLIVGDAG
jgi:hypothetical protein